VSTVKTNSLQIGQSATATNNATWYQPATPDGTVRLGVGNAGATSSDILIANSSGNLGLGVTPSAWSSTFKAFQIGARGSVYAGSDASMRLAYNAYYDGTGYKRIAASSASHWIADTDGSFAWLQAGSSTAGSAISFTQAMTLDASGNLLVGDTAATSTRLTLKSNGNNYTNGAIKIIGASSGTHYITGASGTIYFSNDGSTDNMYLTGGNLTISGATATKASGTTWANPSDTRLKDNQELYTKGLDDLLQIVVKTWEFNGKGGSTKGAKGLGVIADEIERVLPESVDTYSAKLNDEDETETAIKRFDASEVIWLLVNSVKELSAELNELKQKVNA